MYKKNTVAAIVPAYNEEKLILKTLSSIPEFIDKIIVIDDNSSDNTVEIIKKEKGLLRPQGRMSRDPFTALGALYAFFMLNIDNDLEKRRIQEKFDKVTIPLHLQYSFATMKWWRRLKKDDRVHFVKRLGYFKALGTQFTFEQKYEDNFYKNT